MRLLDWMSRNFMRQENLYWWFLFIMMLPCLALSYTEPYSMWLSFASVLLPMAGYMILFNMLRKPGYFLLLCFPLLLINGYQLVLLYLFDEAVISPDMFLTIVTSSAGESGELMRTIWPAVLVACIVYFSGTALAVYSIINGERLEWGFVKRNCWLSLIPAWLGIGALVMNGNRGYEFEAKTDIYPINVLYNLGFSVDKYTKTYQYARTSAGFSFDARRGVEPAGREIYLLVIGETSRACQWELYGYDRPTNLMLGQRDDILVYKDVLSQGNTTHKIVPMLLTAACAEDFESIYSQKSIVTAFKEAGFRTAFVSNQIPDGAFIDAFASEADTLIRVRECMQCDFHPDDNDGVPMIKGVIDNSEEPLFIVYHTYGSHFDYSKRYYRESCVFTPDIAGALRYKEKPSFLNAYDNTICNTDRMLDGLIKLIESYQCKGSMMFISDHGEDLMDDERRLFLHSSPVPSYYQLHVPFVMWFSKEYRTENSEKMACAGNNCNVSVSSNGVFHTMLDIAGIETPYRVDSLSLVNPSYKLSKRYYLDQHDKPADYLSIRLKQKDLNMFLKMNIGF